ncbi:MAG: valine--tRNA ligase [Candidatus Magasanikbacteria bacterium CG_4_9_14_0_2_um_filter_41_10]|uniref:Valine--tRNA ligase n=1 Tax=Candidatus Magasanikbacteria bacterium CG_4_10_14_0_2_um_filter_41_31 TaxID=1974639 RepID=A0A2M7V465_9BACT|nr:MAG: valine--tRNA ligase [Candidatus Magasanikbacteria bacterium CG1_02_41_34]PIZ93312.1 MAG: valine--tRNA ligase [Candidatus Magasanikbacteria bacterium CG_4_10_14_0_2_um_filter_41_31]PJC53944.1 MAG: valine--tRNA ligase [Candidatus Magasanikbacteria bacterium CG_4_9_14_0_2_um_filter_41_10]
MKELPKAYEPFKYEENIYKHWEESGFFNPDVCIEKGITDKDAESFSIVLPPPNVTGTLHIGHAVMLAIEDVMVRYHRMKGDKTLWVPGTDHAAIATQEKVERMLWNDEKKTRHDLGREVFLKRVEDFAQDSHDRIVNQAKRMGTSLDWSREYYSLDEDRNLAVRTAFNIMYDMGLIYRGDRIVNWDPKMQSNVSDIEVVRTEEKAPFYYFQYGPFVISTARPETKFGDKYVVMHPDDERYAKYKHGDTFECEWINGKVTATIIKDDSVDPAFGTGVMTITPWHDATDFFIAERHNLEKEQVIDFDGNLLPVAEEFAGMNILDARPKIVEKLKAKGLLVKVDEEYVHSIATNSRGGGLIEPQIMKQWWVDVKKKFTLEHSHIEGITDGQDVSLQELLQHVVNTKQIQILPDRFEKQYFNWVDNLLDWCLSRQIWYGHRVPAWYRGDDVYVGIDAPEGEGWTQDSDTLDTWFSAGMFSFSPFGGVEGKSEDQKNYHPTSVLETGYDILTFWVVRMILMTTCLRGEIPFKTVYLHGLVRDEQGRKMSKSLDNIIDPLDVSEKFGTDAVRLSLMVGSSPGNDSKLSEEKIGSYRNFANKLWNISRFILMNIENPVTDVKRPEAQTLSDAWILDELNLVIMHYHLYIKKYSFSQAAELLQNFTWNTLADWYLEIAKIEGNKSEILNFILNNLLKLWHPFIPFVTEAIWQSVYESAEMLMVQKMPLFDKEHFVEGANVQMHGFGLIRDIITNIRSLRSEKNIEPGKEVGIVIVCGEEQAMLDENAVLIRGLARVGSLTVTGDESAKPEQASTAVVGSITLHLDLAGAIDVDVEKTRLQKEIDHVSPYVMQLEKKLSNKEFVDNAPEAVIAVEKKKLNDATQKLTALQEQLAML